ncbi:hypothetical protein [Lacrimispora sp.]|uniref:hypothetical protein n=1 Tax=Lacrimispora sp. TaxID=2719234 RepID=UPI002F3E474E
MKIRKATLEDANTISNIYALSWKSAYKGLVPQKYLDELKCTFWVSSFQNWLNNNTLTALLICENELPVGCIAYGKARDDNFYESNGFICSNDVFTSEILQKQLVNVRYILTSGNDIKFRRNQKTSGTNT